MKARRIIGVAVAGTMGAAAALSWSVWVWIAFSSVPSAAMGQGPVIASESEHADRTGAHAE